VPATRAASRRSSTPQRLRRLLALILGATAVLWITATVLVQGQRGTVASVRDGSSPAWVDAVEAHAALSDADRAAWQSFRSGEAQLTGPGQQYQNDITTASQDLERLAALEPAGGPGGEQLQTISGQLVTYQGLVEQADAANRADIALGTASNHDLGYAYLTYASSSMRNPQGGLLASIDQLASLDRQTLGQQFASPWAEPALLLAAAAAGAAVLGSILAARGFLARRFRRAISLPLLAAAALACGLLAWMALVTLPADAAFAAAGGTALPRLTTSWKAQIRSVDEAAAALRGSRPPGPAERAAAAGQAFATSGGLNVTATEPASGALAADLASAGDDGGLPAGIPLLAVAIAGLAFLGIKPRLDEYRR
jgi:hypothetical protein